MFTFKKYTEQDKYVWNEFVANSKNGTFLIDRDYMDYHSDRFEDHSLLIYKDSKLRAILPACRQGNCFCSHKGLTYGGLLTDTSISASEVLSLFAELNEHLRSEGFSSVYYAPTPWIYQKQPSEEDLNALFKVCHATLIKREISSTILLQKPLKWHRDRKYGINRCKNNSITVQRSNRFEAFWKVLDNNLMHTHGVHPVHSIEEMTLLHERFPDNIILYTAEKDGEVLGGTVLYVTSQVVHAQYISASEKGKHLRVIDGIYNVILNEEFKSYPYFDFGKSTEEGGTMLNTSLIYQKEGFGGRGVCYDTYE